MKGIKIYRHMITNNVFGIRDKIKELRKKPNHDNKNRKTKN